MKYNTTVPMYCMTVPRILSTFTLSRFASFMSDRVDITAEEREEHDRTPFEHACFLTSDEDSQDEMSLEDL